MNAADAGSLRSRVFYEAVVGSRAWGLAEEESDEDRRGVYLWSFEMASALEDPPADFTADGGSAQYWEVARAIRLGLRADPNLLEMLWSPIVLSCDGMGERLRAERCMFVSNQIAASFRRYVESQFKVHDRRALLERQKERIAQEVRKRPQTPAEGIADALLADWSPEEVRDAFRTVCRSAFDRGQTRAPTFDAFRAHVLAARPEDLPSGDYRPKGAYHLVRLLHSGLQWLRTGEPLIEVTGTLRDRLLAIKHLRVPLAETLAWARDLLGEFESAREASCLPPLPNRMAAERFLLDCRAEAARGYIDGWFTVDRSQS